MRRIFIKDIKIDVDFGRINGFQIEFEDDIYSIAMNNREFARFLNRFISVWEPRVEEKLIEYQRDLLNSTNGRYIDYIGSLESYLKFRLIYLTDALEDNITELFIKSDFNTIHLIEKEMPVKYFRFIGNNGDDMYLSYESVANRLSTLSTLNKLPKRNVRI
jgi:hypothetical protein